MVSNTQLFASLARLESACIHLINNLPNEVPTDLIVVFKPCQQAEDVGIYVPLGKTLQTEKAQIYFATKRVSAVTGEVRNKRMR